MPAVSNTGPLISACQSQSLPLVVALFQEIHIPTSVMGELKDHDWSAEITAESRIVVVKLTPSEHRRAAKVAKQIAEGEKRRRSVVTHSGEADAIVLAQRKPSKYDFVLLDDWAARQVAKSLLLNVIGFPGILSQAAEQRWITPQAVIDRLECCREQGTHYSRPLINAVYRDLLRNLESS